MRHHAQIAHQMPGRVRIKIPAAKGNPELLEQIRQLFAAMPELQSTRIKPDAGSIVLRYDPRDAPAVEARLMEHWRSAIPRAPRKPPKPRELPGNEFARVAQEIEAEAEFLAGHSHSARVIVDFFKEVDREIKALTNNAVDIKIVLALALAVATFLEIGAHAATPMWVTLALFAVNHFLEMHGTGPHPVASRAAGPVPRQALA